MFQQKPRLWSLSMSKFNQSLNVSGLNVSEEIPPQEMQFYVPADGVILLNIMVTDETETLTIDVSNNNNSLHFIFALEILQVKSTYTCKKKEKVDLSVEP